MVEDIEQDERRYRVVRHRQRKHVLDTIDPWIGEKIGRHRVGNHALEIADPRAALDDGTGQPVRDPVRDHPVELRIGFA